MKTLFERQLLHLTAGVLLVYAVYQLRNLPEFGLGGFLGISTSSWVTLTIAVAIIHQVYVWFCWRTELEWKLLSQIMGRLAFVLYAAGFTVLIVLRPILIFILGWSNRGSLPIDPILGYAVSAILVIPALYLMYSVKTYFGFRRAFGLDHFDPSVRDLPLVRHGIFRWSPNAMYVFGFMVLWVPAFLFQSLAALVVAAFSHIYIWVHFYVTERPDMRRIYG